LLDLNELCLTRRAAASALPGGRRRFRGNAASISRTRAYPDLDAKAAALLHSIARNHALIDGNKRLALAAVIAFYGLNGRRLTLTNDAAYDLIINVTSGQLDTVDAIAAVPQTATRPRR
jgi:death on curing protein